MNSDIEISNKMFIVTVNGISPVISIKYCFPMECQSFFESMHYAIQ